MELLQRRAFAKSLTVRLSWGNTGSLSSVTGWTWSVTCISVLSLSTEGGVYPWPVCAKEQEKYTSCMFILSAIMLVYWGCVNTGVYQVYSFLIWKKRATVTQHKVYKNHHRYTLSAPSLMHDFVPACTAWKENERKNSQHVVQSFGSEVVRLSGGQVKCFSAETSAEIAFCRPSMHMCIALSVFPPGFLFLLKYLKLYFRPRAD